MGCAASHGATQAAEAKPADDVETSIAVVETQVTTTTDTPAQSGAVMMEPATAAINVDGHPLLEGPRAGSFLSALSEFSNGAPLPITVVHSRRRTLCSSTGETERQDNFNCLDMPDVLHGRTLLSRSPSTTCEGASGSHFHPMDLPSSQSASQFLRSGVDSTQALTAITSE
jgi:hypothetical protein